MLVNKQSCNQKVNWSIPLLYAASLGGFPLVSTIPVFFHVESRPISFAYRILVVCLSAVIILRNGILNKCMYLGRHLFVYLMMWTLLMMQLILEYFYPRADTMVYGTEELILMTIGIGFIPMCAFFVCPDRRSLVASYWCSLIASAIALLGIGYASTVVDLRYVISGRLSTEVLNPISVGHLGVSVAILSLVHLHGMNPDSGLIRSVPNSIVFYLLIFLGIGVCFASASRGPLLSLLVVFCVFAFHSVRDVHRRMRLLLPVMIFLLMAITGIAIYMQDDVSIQPLARILITVSSEDESSFERMQVLRDSWQQFLDSPMGGGALVEKHSGSYPHNIVIESFMTTGIIGGLLLLLIIGISSRASLRLVQAGKGYNWVGLLFFQFLTSEMFSGSIFGGASIWLFSAAVVAIDGNLRNPVFRHGPGRNRQDPRI